MVHLIQIKKKKYVDSLLKIKMFHNIKVKTCSHKTLNKSKGVVRSAELSLCSIEEIEKELKNHGVLKAKRMTSWRNNQPIKTNTYILTFDKPKLLKEIKIGYTITKVEPYIPNLLRCYRCQKYGHHEELCRGKTTCGKCGQKDPDHPTNECNNGVKCANCRGDHPVYAKICENWRKEKEILTIQHEQNISYQEARKIVEGQYPKLSYASATEENLEKEQQ